MATSTLSVLILAVSTAHLIASCQGMNFGSTWSTGIHTPFTFYTRNPFLGNAFFQCAPLEVFFQDASRGIASDPASNIIDMGLLKYAWIRAKQQQRIVHENAKYFYDLGVDVTDGHDTNTRFNSLRKSEPFVNYLSDKAQLYDSFAAYVAKSMRLRKEEILRSFNSLRSITRLTQDPMMMQCPYNSQGMTCNPTSKYRTIDGTCNNLRNPLWGRAKTPFKRFLRPVYEDGIEVPRSKGVHGDKLPSPRLVSTTVHEPSNELQEDRAITHLFTLWGQYLDHDISLTPVVKGFNMSDIKCCIEDFDQKMYYNSSMLSHLAYRLRNRPECLPISIPRGDHRFRGRTCMNFVRSSPTTNMDCDIGYREQLNAITAYIDGSNIYGSSVNKSMKLRSFVGGRLKVHNDVTGYRNLLPKDYENKAKCMLPDDENVKCFVAGDARANEQPGLSILHTAWLRQHNLIADGLARRNPTWDDETIYQEARRIVGAMNQHITYNEYLPLLLGKNYMKCYNLETAPIQKPFSPGYRDDIDASVRNVFATAAYRFGHSTVTSNMHRYGKYFGSYKTLNLQNAFFRPDSVYDRTNGGLYSIMRGFCLNRQQTTDRFMTDQLTDHLFEDPKTRVGLDLAAVNVQRGRDHALPSYTKWREWCGLSPVQRFDDLADHDIETRRKFAEVYRSPEDIDLFSGGIAELHVHGGIVGPTFACILARQFTLLKFGDRFWYEGTQPHVRFEKDQLQEIKKTTLAKVICDTMAFESIQPKVFQVVSYSNRHVYCSSLPSINLDKWGCGNTRWSSWTPWSRCQNGPMTCQQTRTRTCVNGNGPRCAQGCQGVRTQVRDGNKYWYHQFYRFFKSFKFP